MSGRLPTGLRGAALLGALMLLQAGCATPARHRVLTFFFDGVPAPREPIPAAALAAAAAAPKRTIAFGVHGPYAAKLCSACHASASSSALVEPRETLCLRCHELKLDKRYVHGPLASGGCTVCHDPHSSQYRYSLVSESTSFCSSCHDPAAVARNPAHAGAPQQCTSCHDAHMSDRRFLLK